MLAKLIQWERCTPVSDGFGEVVIKSTIDDSAKPAIDCRFRPSWLEDHAMLRPADVRIDLQVMDGVVSGRMGQAKISGYLGSLKDAAPFAGRKLAQEVSEHGIDVGLIESGPRSEERR